MATTFKNSLEDFDDIMARYNPKTNRTRNVLTKYELVKLLGVRVEQLQRGARPMVPWPDKGFDARAMAEEELRSRKMPLIICRRLPDGTQEHWRLADMIVAM